MAQLQELITNYTPSRAAAQLVADAKLVLLVGITGAGKDTIKTQLLAEPLFRDIISHTTRKPRINNGTHEVDGRDYHFITEETAAAMLGEQAFIEAKFVHGTVYGTSVAEVEEAYRQGKIAITDIDVQGVTEYKELSPGVVAVFILPPSFSVWQQRLRNRYPSHTAFMAEWPARRRTAIDELTHALELPYYHFIINDDLAEAVRSTRQIALKPDIYTRKDDEARLAARDLLDEIIAMSGE